MTTYAILAQTVHGTASGNYDGSSLDFASDAVQAADYYRGRGSVQTVKSDLVGFQGKIRIQGTLDADPQQAQVAWFDTYTINAVTPLTTFDPHTIPGNFTWMRALVEDFQAGTIKYIDIIY